MVEENNLQVQIVTLRRRLGVQAIATVSGRGQRLSLSVDAPEATLQGVALETSGADGLLGRTADAEHVLVLLGELAG